VYEEKFSIELQSATVENERKIDELTSKLKSSKNQVKYLQTQLSSTRAKLSEAQKTIRNNVVPYKGDDSFVGADFLIKFFFSKKISNADIVNGFLSALMSRKRNINPIASFLIAQEEHLADLRNYFYGRRYKELQDKFKPWLCLRELDLVATVSFSGYQVIRNIEFHGEENTKYLRGLLKSRHELSRVSKLLENHGRQILPYEVSSNAVVFDIERAVPWLLEKFGLWEYVTSGEMVTVAATVDGGELAWQLTQVSAGIKICDERAVDPLTGKHLFGDSGYDNVQSRYVCFPLHVHIAKDNKEFYANHLSSFFHKLNEMEDAYPLGLQFTQGADMCSLQKTVRRGGAMKNKKYGCYCCNVHKDDLAKPNGEPCDDCIQQGVAQPCYHHQVSDESLMEHLQDEYDDLVRDYPYLLTFPFKNSRIRNGTTAVHDTRSDFRHIDFDMANSSVTSRLQFRSLLEKELRLRNMAVSQHTEANRIDLKELLLVEQRFQLMADVLNESSIEQAMIKLEKAVPCLLHLENRISDAMIAHLFRKGLQNVEENATATDQLMRSIELVFNERLFGAPGCASNWKFPVNDNGTMAAIKLSNWRARRVVQNIDVLVETCLPDPSDRDKWNNVFSLFTRVIEVSIYNCFALTYLYRPNNCP
jgi:hypothetical protein